MRKFAVCLLAFFAAAAGRSDIPPLAPPPGLRSRIETDRFRREEIRYHWLMATGTAAFNTTDVEGMRSWRRMIQMPLVEVDSTGLHSLESAVPGETRFMVVLPGDLQYFDGKTRAVFKDAAVAYDRKNDILIVLRDVSAGDWRRGLKLLLYAMEAALPRNSGTIHSRKELAAWEMATETRLRSKLAGD